MKTLDNNAQNIEKKLTALFNDESIQDFVLMSVDPFTPMVLTAFKKISLQKQRQRLLKEIVNDESFVIKDVGVQSGGITKVHPLHKRSKTFKNTLGIAEDLNRAGINVYFLPESENLTSADAVTTINGKLEVVDFKHSSSCNYNTIAEDIIKGFRQAGNVVIKFENADLGVFNNAINQVKRKYGKWGNMKVINNLGKIIDITWRELKSGGYKKKVKGLL